MDTQIIVQGLVQSVGESEFEGAKSYLYQFMTKNKNGKLVLLDVKSKEKSLGITEGEEVKIAVSISCYKDNIYYAAIELVD